jgi:hypothetical protein
MRGKAPNIGEITLSTNFFFFYNYSQRVREKRGHESKKKYHTRFNSPKKAM